MQALDKAPLFSIIVIVDTPSPHLLAHTLKSILMQTGEDYEVIVIEKNSHPLCPAVENNREKLARLYCSLNENIFSMMNKGVGLSKGRYLHFLLPGEYYTTERALSAVSESLEQREVDLICTGFIMRHLLTPPSVFFYHLSETSLERAKYHWSLQSYFIKRDLFSKKGKFNPHFPLQGNFDFLCRLSKDTALSVTYLKRVLTDYEIRKFSPEIAFEEAIERLKVIIKYFGFGRAFFWWIAQNHTQFFKWWFRAIRESLWRTQ